MKTFKNLCVNDKIFIIVKDEKMYDSTDHYGNEYKSGFVKERTVKKLYLKSDFLVIDEVYEIAKIPIDKINDSFYDVERYIYFSDESQYVELVRKFIVDEINKNIESIKTYKENTLKSNECLRKKYYHFLK